ncbi:MFS transporter [Rhodospirillales bacterium TMPK1]|uniref:MFS transporter n=1 Tax=Roseiterribacter gracilis TaxID=2812848 RepID=A0A8S8XEY8_9PROT|nr:MFS transporter [Rhodospirillales bacterium TMPK1]
MLAWCLYDVGLAAFNTVIVTFVFPVYFAKAIWGDETSGSAAWGFAMGAAGIAVAILSPVVGAIADQQRRVKPFLIFFGSIVAAASAGLWFALPDRSNAIWVLLVVGASAVAFELAFLFYNALLPRLAPPAKLGRLSGWGWSCAYLGGIACLALALVGFVQPQQAWFGLSHDKAEHIRATTLLVAAWYLVFTLPLLLILREGKPALSIGAAARKGMARLRATLREARSEPNLWRFLLASALYRDGLATVFAMGGLYAAGTFGMAFDKVVLLAIGLNIAAGIGAILFAWLDDFLGSKPTVRLSLIGLIATGVPLLLVEDTTMFVVFALALSLFVGPTQAASRSLLVRLSPPERTAELFGLYGLTGRAFTFLGPFSFSLATTATGSQRVGMSVVVAFFVLGWALLETVRVQRSG